MADEKRLIDANGSYTLNECNETGHSLCFGGGFIDVYDPKGKHICQFWVGDAPTVDAVEVVLCQNCGHHTTDTCPKDKVWCRRLSRYMDADGFCSYGERKDNERKAD